MSGPLFPDHIYKFNAWNNIWLHFVPNFCSLFKSVSYANEFLFAKPWAEKADSKPGRGEN
jgi:hypothetical protein